MQYRRFTQEQEKYSEGEDKPLYKTTIASSHQASAPQVKLAHMVSHSKMATCPQVPVSREQQETNQRTELDEWERDLSSPRPISKDSLDYLN
jgi:hypothetical protein